ncbi:MAG: tyrosine-type recombinase/integrase [Hyphomonadaceae bacterium]
MTSIDLAGAHRIRRLYPKAVRLDFYAWRGKGAPRIGSYRAATEAEADALASADAVGLAARYGEAKAAPAGPSTRVFKGLVAAYRASPEFKSLAPSTRRVWGRWLDRIDDTFGEATTRSMGEKGARKLILVWRDRYADQPRTADLAIQVLSRVLSWGVDREEIDHNRARGIAHLWEADWSDSIWEPTHLRAFEKAAHALGRAHLLTAVQVLAHTGLRVDDAARLAWDDVNLRAGEIRKYTSKSMRRGKKKRAAVIPITPALRAILKAIPHREGALLRTARGTPFATGGTLSEAIQEVVEETSFTRRTHDLRGTAATNFALAQLSKSEIARILAWSEDQVAKILDVYVNPGRISRQIARKLAASGNGSRNGSRGKLAKMQKIA